MSQIALRYSKALFELAKKAKAVESIQQDLQTLVGLLTSSHDLKGALFSKRYGRPAQKNVVSELARRGKFHPLTQSFLTCVAQNGRLRYLAPMVSFYQKYVYVFLEQTLVEVTTVSALTAIEIRTLTKNLTSQLASDIILDLKVDTALVGGMRLRIGSKLIDNSYQTQLRNLYLAMKGV